jgi:hypothetical protein
MAPLIGFLKAELYKDHLIHLLEDESIGFLLPCPYHCLPLVIIILIISPPKEEID